jgi:hypothetical protein
MTYNRANFPVYCAHGPPMELVDIERRRVCRWSSQHRSGKQHCSFIIYKDKSKVPEKYYGDWG